MDRCRPIITFSNAYTIASGSGLFTKLFKHLFFYAILEAVIQADERRGNRLLSAMFSHVDPNRLAMSGFGGAEIIDIRRDPNRSNCSFSLYLVLEITYDDLCFQIIHPGPFIGSLSLNRFLGMNISFIPKLLAQCNTIEQALDCCVPRATTHHLRNSNSSF